MRRTFTLLIFCLAWSWAPSQSVQQDWAYFFGKSSDEVIRDAVEASNGTLVAVGYTESMAGKGRDGLLLIVDTRNGQKIQLTNFGGQKDDRLDAVVQTNNGTFLLAGSTESAGSGKRDGWLLAVDERGRKLWEATYGSDRDDDFRAVVWDPINERAYVGGVREDGKANDIWVMCLEGQQVVWEKQFGRGQYDALEAMILSRSGVLITGNTQKSSQRDAGDIYLTQIDLAGQQQWTRYYGDRDWEEVHDITVAENGDFALVGSTNSIGAGRLDFWLLRTDGQGYQKWNRPFGGRDDDEGFAVAPTYDGGFLVAGKTRSHAPNARSHKALVLKVDAGGTLEWQRNYGGNRDDEVNAAYLAHDGRLLLGGTARSEGAGGSDAWVFALRDASTPTADVLASLKSGTELARLSPATLHTHDQKLKPDDQTYLSFRLENISEFDLPNVQLEVTPTSGARGVQVWTNNFVGKLPAQSPTVVRVPVSADQNLQTGKVGFRVRLLSGNVPLAESATVLESKKPIPARLDIANYQFRMLTQERGASYPNIRLTLDLNNTGDYSTTEAIVQLGIPQGLEIVREQGRLGTVPPGGRATAVFEFRKTARYNGDRATVVCITRNAGQEQSRQPYTIDLNNPAGTTAGGQALADMLLIWTEPSQDERDLDNIRTQDPNFPMRMTLVSQQRIRTNDIGVYVNDNALEGNKDLDEELIAPKEGLNTYTYRRTIPLQEGENIIYLKVNEKESRRIRVTYTPRSRNLHVLAIGPRHEDLKYTNQDARDFAQAFRTQSGKLFNEVFIHEHTTPEMTTRDEIQKAVLDLANQYRNEDIQPNDVLLVFISSHGIIGTGDRFKILPTGYDSRYGDRFTIDYQDDVIDPLSQVGCKKIILIDACHSGASGSRSATAADTRRSEMVARINASAPGLSTLASCKSFEMSYEDDSWQNGAFTEAILEALQNRKIMDRDGNIFQASTDDQFLTIGELYQYVQRRVNQLVSQYKPDAPTRQTPYMTASELDMDFPLFELTQQ